MTISTSYTLSTTGLTVIQLSSKLKQLDITTIITKLFKDIRTPYSVKATFKRESYNKYI